MAIFESKRDKIRKFLKDKEWATVDDIAQGTGLSKTKAKQTLEGLKGKEIEVKDDKYNLIPIENQTQNNIPSISEVQTEGVVPVPPELTPSEPHVQKIGLTAKISEMEKKLDMAIGIKQEKEKKAKLKKFSIGKVKRFNKKRNRAVILLGSDQSARLIKGEYIQGNIAMIRIGENYYEGTVRYIWQWEGKQPIYIIPQWSLRPLCAEEVYKRAKEDGTLIDSQIINLRAVQLLELDKEEGKKPKMNMMIWIGLAAAGLIIAWLFFGGKK